MKAFFELVETDQQVTQKILRALKIEINRRIARANVALIPRVRALIGQAIKAQPEYTSLDGGKLAASFGLPDGKARIDTIIEAWLNNIQIKVKRASSRGSQISAGIEIRGIKADYEDILNLPEASVSTNKGQILPWLDWLLTYGDKAIVVDYSILFAPIGRKRSRSGRAIMIQKEGSRWRVPPEFSGTESNNFVTRALASIGPELDKTVQQSVTKALNI